MPKIDLSLLGPSAQVDSNPTSPPTLAARASRANLGSIFRSKVAPREGRGADRTTVRQFAVTLDANLEAIETKLKGGDYRFTAYLEKLIPRGPHKTPRQISLPTVRDRVTLQLLKELLHDQLQDCVPRDLPNTYIRRLKQFAEGNDLSSFGLLRTDIADFYSSVRHERLLAMLGDRKVEQAQLDLVRGAIRNSTCPLGASREQRRRRSSVGVPQGLPISNVLAQLYLKSLDAQLEQRAALYLRYVDDLLILVPVQDLNDVTRMLGSELAALGLALSEAKTQMGPATDPFAYLGYACQLPSVGVRPQAVQRFLDSVASLFAEYRAKLNVGSSPAWLTASDRQRAFLEDLNERLTGAVSETRRYGWAAYYSELTDETVLHRVDAVVRRMFLRLPDFPAVPSKLKSVARAFYEMRYSPNSGYVFNYNRLASPAAQWQYLVVRGLVDPSDENVMSVDEIERRFMAARDRKLSRLEKDVGFVY